MCWATKASSRTTFWTISHTFWRPAGPGAALRASRHSSANCSSVYPMVAPPGPCGDPGAIVSRPAHLEQRSRIEAMKMQTQIVAERDVTIDEVWVKPGDPVSAGDLLGVLA